MQSICGKKKTINSYFYEETVSKYFHQTFRIWKKIICKLKKKSNMVQ